uniref:Uncharacterized protein n=1 Tax=Anguilla anguilla TaxID=7936 RepID=A0A0E9W1Z2_ANGAN
MLHFNPSHGSAVICPFLDRVNDTSLCVQASFAQY